MIKFKVIGISIVVATMFGSASCMAQFSVAPEIKNSAALPLTLPRATQVKRCQDFGRYVNLVASARDAGESQQKLIGRLGLNMSSPGGQGLIHQRLPANTLAAGGPVLVREIYASNASPANWQAQVSAVCEKQVIS